MKIEFDCFEKKEGEIVLAERVPPFRIKVRDKRTLSPWIYVIIGLLFMGILLVLFFQSPLNRIEEIRIHGNHLVSKEQILKASNLQQTGSFFYVNSSHIKNKLEEMPEIQHANIEKSFPNRININIKEFPVIAYVQREDGWFVPILWNGEMLLDHPQTDLIEAMPIIHQKDRTNQTVQLALQNLMRISKQIRADIEFVYAVPEHPDRVRLISKYHHQIYIRAKDLHEKLIYYPQFRKHPSGTLFLLQSIWFSPTNEN